MTKCLYEGGLKSSWADYDAMVEFDQMWFTFQFFLFNFYFFSLAVHTLLPSGVAALGFPWYRSSQSWSLNKSSTADMTSLSIWNYFPAKCFFVHVGEQKIVRWCQIRKIWRLINQFKATATLSSHCNHRLVCRSIVLVKQDSPCQFSRQFWIVSSTTFRSPELLIQCGLSGKKQCS